MTLWFSATACPHLEFSSPAWSPWLQWYKNTLEKVQEKAVKMVAGLKGGDYSEKCVELGLETLEAKTEKAGHGACS
jgi:ribonucleases P/MRP protein subunit RPP40